jgi:hypothetical protein
MWTNRKRQNDGAYGPRPQRPATPQQGDQRWKTARNEAPPQKTMLGRVGEDTTMNEIGRFIPASETGATMNEAHRPTLNDVNNAHTHSAPNLLAEFGILQEGSRATTENSARFTCNMATLIKKDPTLADAATSPRRLRGYYAPSGHSRDDWAACWEKEPGCQPQVSPAQATRPNCPYEPQTTIWAARTLCQLSRENEGQPEEDRPLFGTPETLNKRKPPMPRRERLSRTTGMASPQLGESVVETNGIRRRQGPWLACQRIFRALPASQDPRRSYDKPKSTRTTSKLGAHNSIFGTKVPGIQHKRSPMWSQTSLMAIPRTGDNPGVRASTPIPSFTERGRKWRRLWMRYRRSNWEERRMDWSLGPGRTS